MSYVIVPYVRAEVENLEVFKTREEAEKELEHFEAMNTGENIFEIEEVD